MLGFVPELGLLCGVVHRKGTNEWRGTPDDYKACGEKEGREWHGMMDGPMYELEELGSVQK